MDIGKVVREGNREVPVPQWEPKKEPVPAEKIPEKVPEKVE